MAGLPDLTAVYDGEIAGQSLNTANRIWQNPRVLLAPPAKRGQNLVVPRAAGSVPMLHLPAEQEVSLRVVFIGDVNAAGVTQPNPAGALLDALEAFRDAVLLHGGVDVACWVTDPRGQRHEGRVQPVGFDWGDSEDASGLATCRSVLRLKMAQPLAKVASP